MQRSLPLPQPLQNAHPLCGSCTTTDERYDLSSQRLSIETYVYTSGTPTNILAFPSAKRAPKSYCAALRLLRRASESRTLRSDISPRHTEYQHPLDTHIAPMHTSPRLPDRDYTEVPAFMTPLKAW